MRENCTQAIRNHLQAVDLDPGGLETFNNLAVAYKKRKNLEKVGAVFYEELGEFAPSFITTGGSLNLEPLVILPLFAR